MKPARLFVPIWLATLIACAGGDPLAPAPEAPAAVEPPSAWTASSSPDPGGDGDPDPKGGEHGSGN